MFNLKKKNSLDASSIATWRKIENVKGDSEKSSRDISDEIRRAQLKAILDNRCHC